MSERVVTTPSKEAEDAIGTILREARTIAVVGLSAKSDRDSYRVACYLQEHGYRIVPVNPGLEKVLGERCYPDLPAIPAELTVDVANVFRRGEHVPEVVDQAIARGVKAIWLQLGIAHSAATAKARAAGIEVIESRCFMVEHARRHAY